IIYHGSLALRNPTSRYALNKLLVQNSDSIFIDVNLRPPWYESRKILTMLERAKWAKLNEGELCELTENEKNNNVFKRTQKLQIKMDLDLVIVTQGAKGAFALDNKGDFFEVRPSNNVQIVDTVGAGDAFSSVCILGLTKDWGLYETLYRAQEFATAIVGQRGATVKENHFYTKFIKHWLLD
ncbi:MAG: PfkB family carbohydrate kinase, partial [Gammaproteobacteria bacterium]